MLGRTVGELLDSVSYPELLLWADYLQIDPETEWRADVRTAQVCSTLANINRDPKKKPEPYQVKEFLLFETESMIARIRAKEAEKKDMPVEVVRESPGAKIAPETVQYLFAASRKKVPK